MTDNAKQPDDSKPKADNSSKSSNIDKQFNLGHMIEDIFGLNRPEVNTDDPNDKPSAIGKVINKAGQKIGKIGTGIGEIAQKGIDAVQGVLDELPPLKDIDFDWPVMHKPQVFPTEPGGRLPASIEVIQENRGDCFYKGPKEDKPCQKIIKISFFFDGTNNHEKADKVVSGAEAPTEEELKKQDKAAPQAKMIAAYTYPRTSNVARLFHACMGAGGTPGEVSYSSPMIENGWFKHYIQGVGTRFEEIGDLDPGFSGEMFARYGQSRINWALTRLCATLGLCKVFNEKPLLLTTAQKMIKGMDSKIGRKNQLDEYIESLVFANSNQPLPQAIKLYVIGFSRGAAEGRTFINWLLEYLLERPENADAKKQLEKLMEQRRQQRKELREYYRKYPEAKAEAQKQAIEEEKAASSGVKQNTTQNGAKPGQGPKSAPPTPGNNTGNQQNNNNGTSKNSNNGPVNGANTTVSLNQSGNINANRKDDKKTEPKPEFIYLKLRGIPIYIEMAGLFDTVANVGMSPLTSLISGHFGWAHGTMSLEQAAAARFVKSCYHFVAGHEQRRSFSVESICIDGGYPRGGGAEFREYTYPGVHADIGGGYPPGAQFKSNFGMGHVVAQITLHDMYARCWQHGMPLQVWKNHPVLDEQIKKLKKKSSKFKLNNYEIMPNDVIKEFDTQPEMVQRFNAWLETTVLDNITKSLQQQVHHITAWRILRWVKDGIDGYATFLGLAITRKKGSAGEKEDAEQVSAREKIIAQGRKEANEKLSNASGGLVPASTDSIADDDKLWQQAGLGDIPAEKRDDFLNGMINKNYDPVNDGWDMLESAKEFKADYLHEFRFESFLSLGFLMKTFAGSIYMLNNVDEAAEFKDIHEEGDKLYFGDPAKNEKKAPPPAPSQDDGFEGDPVATGATPPIAPPNKKDKSGSIFDGLFENLDIGAVATGIILDRVKDKINKDKKKAEAAKDKSGKKPEKVSGKDNALAILSSVWERLNSKDKRDVTVLMDKIKKTPEQYSKTFGKIVTLFDEQIHDSRAKYMHSILNDREPFTSYFAHRLVFSGSTSNKQITPLMLQNNLIGIAGLTRSAYMSIRYGNPAYILLGLNNPEFFVTENERKAFEALINGFDAIAVNPDTGKIILNGKNIKNIYNLYQNSQQSIQKIKEAHEKLTEWNGRDFADKITQEIAKYGDETIKNLQQIRQLLEEQKAALKAAAEAEKQKKQAELTQSQAAAMAKANEAQANEAEAGGAETAAQLEQQLNTMISKIDKNINQLQSLLESSGSSGDASALEHAQELLKQLDPQLVNGLNLNNLSNLDKARQALNGAQNAIQAGNITVSNGSLVNVLPAQQQLADINPQSMADYLSNQIAQYQQNLLQQTKATVSLMQNGVNDPQTLAQVFYRNAQGDIADQVVNNISKTTLNNMGMSDLELNEFLPENIANRSQIEIIQLVQQLRSGNVPAELQSLPKYRLQLMAKVLESWLV